MSYSRTNKTNIIKALKKEVDNLEVELRNIEDKMKILSSIKSIGKSDDFDVFINTRDNLTYKISVALKKIDMIKATGRINGEEIECVLPSGILI
jgi:hypothetical protein